MNRTVKTWPAALAAALLLAGSAAGAPLPKTHVKVIGYFSNLAQTRLVEKPFWTQTLEKDSNGAVNVDYNNMDVLGVNDFQILHMTQLGVTDFAATDISKMAGDDPVFEGCDLAGITSDIETARKACDAWRPVMAEHMKDKFQTRLMILMPNPPIVFWCRDKIAGLADLKSWDKFPPAVRAFFTKEFAALETGMWKIGAQATEQGINCNTGHGECTLGKKGAMMLVKISPADEALRKKLVQDVVLVDWGKRCGKPCAEKWNETVGKVVHLGIPLDKL